MDEFSAHYPPAVGQYAEEPPTNLKQDGGGGSGRRRVEIVPNKLCLKIIFGIVWSFLCFNQYDFDLFGSHASQGACRK